MSASGALVPFPLSDLLDSLSIDGELHVDAEVAIGKCMAARGFVYTPASVQPALSADRRFWVDDPEYAAENGYTSPLPATQPQPVDLTHLTEAERRAYGEALLGVEMRSAANGQLTVMTGGCLDSAELEVVGTKRFDRIEASAEVERLAAEAYFSVREGEALQGSVSEWSQCVAEKGFGVFASPGQAIEEGMSLELEEQVRLAVADAECNQSTGLTRRFRELVSEAEQELASKNEGLILAAVEIVTTMDEARD